MHIDDYKEYLKCQGVNGRALNLIINQVSQYRSNEMTRWLHNFTEGNLWVFEALRVFIMFVEKRTQIWKTPVPDEVHNALGKRIRITDYPVCFCLRPKGNGHLLRSLCVNVPKETPVAFFPSHLTDVQLDQWAPGVLMLTHLLWIQAALPLELRGVTQFTSTADPSDRFTNEGNNHAAQLGEWSDFYNELYLLLDQDG